MSSTEKIYSVSALNREAQRILDSSFGSFSLEGEISNITHHSSGHIYFTLKDEESAVDAVMFKSSAASLKFRPERGDKVLVRASVSIYARTGRYQLMVRSMKERGAGDLEARFIRLKEKLRAEGVFDPSKKKPLPPYPSLIGIVTSPTGAAIRDILNVMERRFSGIEVIIYPARVQGDGAADEVAAGVRYFNENYPDMDLIIVGRGGGSLEDLWPFNEEVLARAIFASLIPVISAVGHETDITISDFAADLRAPTPSAAAEMVTRDKEELMRMVIKLYSSIRSASFSLLESGRRRFIREISSPVFKNPLMIMKDKMQDADLAAERLVEGISREIERKKGSLDKISACLEALSPKKTLERGYSITFSGKIPLRSAAEAEPGIILKSVFSDGSIKSRVVSKEVDTDE